MKSCQNQINDNLCSKAVHKRLVKFVEKIVNDKVTRPEFKFICETVGGILFAGNLIVRNIALALIEKSKAPCTIEKRISLH